jgi:hypothetical protein
VDALGGHAAIALGRVIIAGAHDGFPELGHGGDDAGGNATFEAFMATLVLAT